MRACSEARCCCRLRPRGQHALQRSQPAASGPSTTMNSRRMNWRALPRPHRACSTRTSPRATGRCLPRARACMLTIVAICWYACMRACVCAIMLACCTQCMHACMHACMHTCTPVYTPTHAHILVRIHTCMHTYMHTCIRAYIHARTRARARAHTHTHTHTQESGNLFDSSYERGKPLQFAVGTGRVIKGWDEALLTMRVGGRRMLVIPAELGYGAKGIGPIPPNADLVFYVELVAIGS